MPSSEKWTKAKHRLIAAALSFVAGYTDAISVTRWHVFATMMTGNLIYVGRSTVNAQSNDVQESYTGAWYYALVLLTFSCGVAAWKLAEHCYPDRGASTVGIPFAFLMVTMELVLMWTPWVRGYTMAYSLTVLAYAPMFGVMNAACTAGRLATTTTVATGHMVTVVSLAVKALCLRQELSQAERGKCIQSVAIIGSTLAGVMLGVAVYLSRGKGSHGALIPVGPALAVLFWLHDHLAKPSSLVKKAQALKQRAANQILSRRLLATACDEASKESEGSEDESDEGSLSGSECGESGTPSSAAAQGWRRAEAGGSQSSLPPTLLTSVALAAQLESGMQKVQAQASHPVSSP